MVGLIEILGKYPNPDTYIEYRMKDSPGGEFRIELYNFFENQPEELIKELNLDQRNELFRIMASQKRQ